jgi:AcrR family transcriptional regulator
MLADKRATSLTLSTGRCSVSSRTVESVARHVKPDEFAAHRRQILAAARKLVHDKGYEHMTVQDVLDELQISKGALYHYFDSKQALLEGVVEAMGESGCASLRAVVDDPDLGAIEKLTAYFHTMRRWGGEDSVALRQKLSEESMRTATPLLEAIIRQGRSEGVFDTQHPRDAAVILAGMGQQLADTGVVAAYTDAVERILGAPQGSLTPP